MGNSIVANRYQQDRLGGLLKIGKAQMVGVVTPNGDEGDQEYYLVTDVIRDATWLVPVADRRKWKRYVKEKQNAVDKLRE